MAKKTHRVQRAARGTAADPGRGTEGQRSSAASAAHATPSRTKLHGVISEAMVDEQVKRSGTYPFTFSSSLILFAAAFVGAVLTPYAAEALGHDVRVASVLGLSVLLSAALAMTRYFLDSRRGLCRGFWITLVVSFAACLLVSGLLVFSGIVL